MLIRVYVCTSECIRTHSHICIINIAYNTQEEKLKAVHDIFHSKKY